MAELENACCAPAAQATCCEPEDKTECCGDRHSSGCGCSAGAATRPGATATVSRSARPCARSTPPRRRPPRLEQPPAAAALPIPRACSARRCMPQTDEVPEGAVGASLGCGVPTAVADLHEGEIVLDLGSGAGADVLISARRVGPTGRAIGIDMTDEMLELARRNAAEAGVENVEFRQGVPRGAPAPGRKRRRRDLQLRDQPLRR